MIYIINSLLVGWEVQNFIRAKTESIIKKGVAYINLLVTISQLDPSLVLQYRDVTLYNHIPTNNLSQEDEA